MKMLFSLDSIKIIFQDCQPLCIFSGTNASYKLLGNKEGGKSCISLKGCVDGKNKRKLHYFDQWLVATKDLLHA